MLSNDMFHESISSSFRKHGLWVNIKTVFTQVAGIIPCARISASRNARTSVSNSIVRFGERGVPSLEGSCIACCARNAPYFRDPQYPIRNQATHRAGRAAPNLLEAVTSVRLP